MQKKKWINSLFDGTINDDELEKLNDWYALESEKALMNNELEEQIPMLKNRMLTKLQTDVIEENLNQKSSRKVITRKFKTMATASVSLIGFLFMLSWFFSKSDQNMTAFSNDTNTVKQVILPDGTLVWLNANASIQYSGDFNEEDRMIYLKGEAYFDVIRDIHKPFVVESGNAATIVLGTEFNINARNEDHIVVSVAEGIVRVEEKNYFENDENRVLTIGQEVVYSKTSGLSEPIEFDSDICLSWKMDTLRFDGVKLSKAFAMLEKKYDVDIKVKNKSINECEIFGEYGNDELSDILETMSFALGFSVKANESDATIVINGNGCD
ncbi:FecR family protein [Aureibacter tunicatorum]|uniref:Ferric-dicitrate binding protein FerR (Iron transport regulator) n=1 Tax=Aureibacter tunicatorum TaxID=866807 RepID=A0AAE3XR12_9BACT|nr:FecR domain-containing protein [Aureibacter tunicatorum]MDR6240331.1 ferric-dicitrate binding protein FerR (iron transport regulator) [Aureibacter tunicatorum]BDD05788.1 anti-sigma factor [Aureibacter tunicatorum]